MNSNDTVMIFRHVEPVGLERLTQRALPAILRCRSTRYADPSTPLKELPLVSLLDHAEEVRELMGQEDPCVRRSVTS